MTAAFLALNALVYLGLGLWCTLDPDGTSRAIGFAFAKSSARSEYVTVYGGLEVGLGLFFAVAAWYEPLRAAGLLFALLTYGCLALFRIGTIVAYGDVGRFPWIMLAIELPMAAIAAFLFWRGGGA